jgi:hypothetical protein
MGTSQESICKCGKMKFWITEGEVTKKSCPQCGRKYCGQYNPKTLKIEAIEVQNK